MSAIILEGVLFVALLAAVGALVRLGVQSTPVGRRLRQAQNRVVLDRAAAATCPIHGLQNEDDLVRLPEGGLMCPHCYQENVHGQLDR
jgi:hypothetical protein